MCKRRREQRDRFSLRRGGGTFPSDIPSAVNPSSRETTPRKTVERRWTWNRRGGGGNLLRKRGTDFIKWQYLRRRRRRRNVKSFTFSSFLLPPTSVSIPCSWPRICPYFRCPWCVTTPSASAHTETRYASYISSPSFRPIFRGKTKTRLCVSERYRFARIVIHSSVVWLRASLNSCFPRNKFF